MRESCGVFGIYAPGIDISRLIFFALFALQHRGQESAGIAVTDGTGIKIHTNMGLVSQVFTENDLALLRGYVGIGHNRYSTTGSSKPANAQPVIAESEGLTIALAHNGNIIIARLASFEPSLKCEVASSEIQTICVRNFNIIIRTVEIQGITIFPRSRSCF